MNLDVLDLDAVRERAAYLSSLGWRARARCRGVDTSVFYARRGDNITLEVAKRICRGCPVKVECLQYALERGERFGTWGGVSEARRRGLRARRARADTPD